MKILFFTENLRAGGKERRITELIRHLIRVGGFEVKLVLTADIIHYEEIHHLNIPIHIIERRWIKKDPGIFFRFYRIARAFRPDVIHAWGHMTAFYAIPARILLNVPLINNEIVDATIGKPLLFRKLVFHFSDRIIANSRAGLLAYKAPIEKSTVIVNGFAADRLRITDSEEDIRKKYGITTPYIIAMVASFLPYKDYRTFLKAAVIISAEREDVTFLCVGDGDDSSARSLVPFRFRHRILFPGRQTQVERLMSVCTIGVLTTHTGFHGEGISNALMEFMALGKPVIATRHGGTPELVDDGITGFLIAAFSIRQLRDMITWLLVHPDLRKGMGKRAHQMIADRFSMDRMLESFQREYHHLVDGEVTTVPSTAA